MEQKIIKDFCKIENRFLSNFYPYATKSEKTHPLVVVKYDGLEFDNVESAYQAAKCKRHHDRIQFQEMNPFIAKNFAKKANLEIREDWNEAKFRVMYDLVWQKFHNCEELRQMLLATGDTEIIEGNAYGDIYWGICNGIGENHLGKILMRVRNAIK